MKQVVDAPIEAGPCGAIIIYDRWQVAPIAGPLWRVARWQLVEVYHQVGLLDVGRPKLLQRLDGGIDPFGRKRLPDFLRQVALRRDPAGLHLHRNSQLRRAPLQQFARDRAFDAPELANKQDLRRACRARCRRPGRRDSRG